MTDTDGAADDDPLVRDRAAHLDTAVSHARAACAELDTRLQSTSEAVAEIDRTRKQVSGASVTIDTLLQEAEALGPRVKAVLGQLTATADEATTLYQSAISASEQARDLGTQASGALENLKSALGTASEGAVRVEGLRTQVEQSAAIAAKRSEHLEAGRVHADEVRAKIDKLFTDAQQSSTGAEAQYLASKSAIDNLSAVQAAAQAAKATTESVAGEITSLKRQAEEHATVVKRMAESAGALETRLALLEAKLAELQVQASTQLATIESLLPGATSAGLASAFGLRREQFTGPLKTWERTFVASVVVLLGIGVADVWTGLGDLSLEKLGLRVLYRLPIAIPLVWLALYAARQASLAKQVEEEYAFKETMSRSFEGYRKLLLELEGKAAAGSALATFCSSTLGVITNPPSRIYDTKRSDVSPATALADSAEPIARAAAEIRK